MRHPFIQEAGVNEAKQARRLLWAARLVDDDPALFTECDNPPSRARRAKIARGLRLLAERILSA